MQEKKNQFITNNFSKLTQYFQYSKNCQKLSEYFEFLCETTLIPALLSHLVSLPVLPQLIHFILELQNYSCLEAPLELLLLLLKSTATSELNLPLLQDLLEKLLQTYKAD